MDHYYLESGWCVCGHHRDDGRNERDQVTRLDLADIRQLLDNARNQPTDTDHQEQPA